MCLSGQAFEQTVRPKSDARAYLVFQFDVIGPAPTSKTQPASQIWKGWRVEVSDTAASQIGPKLRYSDGISGLRWEQGRHFNHRKDRPAERGCAPPVSAPLYQGASVQAVGSPHHLLDPRGNPAVANIASDDPVWGDEIPMWSELNVEGCDDGARAGVVDNRRGAEAISVAAAIGSALV